MSFEIVPTDNFKTEVKKLAKKHRSLKKDIESLENELIEQPTKLGEHLGNSVYKIRLAIKSKGKGKSGGARVITYVYIENEQVFLVSIYDKSQKETISQKEIDYLLKQIDF